MNGPKVNCIKCKKVCFLYCFGFDKHADGFIKTKINNATIIFEVENFTFVCPGCDSFGLIVSSKLKSNAAVINTQSPSSKMLASKDINKIYTELGEIKALINGNGSKFGEKLDEVKNISEDARLMASGMFSRIKSNEAAAKTFMNNDTNNKRHPFERPVSGTPRHLTFQPRWNSVNKDYEKEFPQYSTVLAKRTPVVALTTPTTNKRKREHELSLIDNKTSKTVAKVTLPEPKSGKKMETIGKPVLQKVPNRRTENPLSKSIWISGVHPETENDVIEDYIVRNTIITDKTKFKCTKLIKKDQDLSKMSFISFKIDVSPDDFNVLMNEEIWPSNVKIREFIKMQPPKRNLDQFLPTQPNANSPASPNAKRQPNETKTNEQETEQKNEEGDGMDT